MNWLLVAAGGALGSAARYGVSQAAALWVPGGYPLGTFLVNAVGCAIFGLLAGAGEARGVMTPGLRAFCFAGVLGGFTTFSSYAFDSFVLARGGAWGLALFNTVAQVVVGCAAVAVGWWLGHAFS